MKPTIEAAISAFGAAVKAKLSNPAVSGQPEDQIRAPFEQLLSEIALIAGLSSGSVAAVGESVIGHLKTRPDYAVTVQNALVGFIELKAEFGNLAWPTSAVCFGPPSGTLMLGVLGSAGA